jgi:hypothetical protein
MSNETETLECNWYDVPCHASWLQQEVSDMALSAYETVLMGFADFLDLIPVPAWADPSLITIPGSVYYFLDLFNAVALFSIVNSAYLIRFVIRRLPVVG